LKKGNDESHGNYRMEELVSIVGKLAEKYTAFESSSVTVEKANQLMEAVLYCIHEAERPGADSAAGQRQVNADGQHPGDFMSDGETGKIEANIPQAVASGSDGSVRRIYEVGVQMVEQKVKSALDLYNEILPQFKAYENHCLYDTFMKGLPEFFKWYDVKFDPQNTILTLDYPLLKDFSDYSGIDLVYEFIACIRLEQIFLGKFPESYVINVLERQDGFYQDMVENISGLVLEAVLVHILAEKPLSEPNFEEADYLRIQEAVSGSDLGDVKCRLRRITEIFLKENYENSGDLLAYMAGAADGLAVRLKTALDHGSM